MKYAFAIWIGVCAAACAGAVTFIALTVADDDYTTIAWAGEEVKDTNGDGILSGRELTIEDWIRCRDRVNEMAVREGRKTTETLPELVDDQWAFQVGNKAKNPDGAFYSCGR